MGEIPSGLADIPPGLELAVALAGVDPARVSNHHRPTVAFARRRQLTHHQALMLAETVELGRCTPLADRPRRLPEPNQWAEGEIAAQFTCSERAARAEVDFAEQRRAQPIPVPPRPHLRLARLPALRPQFPHRPHPRVCRRRIDRPGEHRPAVRPPPPVQTAGVWKVRQIRPGVCEWTSPLGRTHRTRAEPFDPPPPVSDDPDPPPH